MNYQDKKFKLVTNTENGDLSADIVFHYKQENNIVTCSYQDQHVIQGHLIGLVDKKGTLDIRYHQVNRSGEIMTGVCHSTPEVLPNGKLRLLEKWQWTSGDCSKGNSVLEEI